MTVAKRSVIPIVCRQTPRSPVFPSVGVCSDRSCDLDESVDFLFTATVSACDLGAGRMKSSAGTGGTGPFIIADGFPEIDNIRKDYALGTSNCPLLYLAYAQLSTT
jgi:hypothetical protein